MKIDTETLEELNRQLSKLTDDMEETWYLIKYLLNEMDIEVLYNNYGVDQELRSAYRKLEELVERFNAIKRIMNNVPYDYEDILERHKEQIELMGEYSQGLKSSYHSLSDINHKERIHTVYTNTAPIKDMLEELYDIEGVIKDE